MNGLSPTANDRFKAGGGRWTALGVIGAVAVHTLVFVLVRPFEVSEVRAAEEPMRLVLPPEARIPPSPEEIRRPAAPVLGDLELAPEMTIPRQQFDRYRPKAVDPPRSTTVGRGPRFVPYDTPPRLTNGGVVQAALERLFPRRLKEAGIGGRVELWLYIDQGGRVTRTEVKTSSGSAALDEAARSVGLEMRFSPALNRDRPTAVWVSQWISFVVRERSDR